MTQNKYIAAYFYGSGGVWMYILSETEQKITQKYPELKVFNEPPEWWKGSLEEEGAKTLTYDLDKPPEGVLEAIIQGRGTAK